MTSSHFPCFRSNDFLPNGPGIASQTEAAKELSNMDLPPTWCPFSWLVVYRSDARAEVGTVCVDTVTLERPCSDSVSNSVFPTHSFERPAASHDIGITRAFAQGGPTRQEIQNAGKSRREGRGAT
jgi:hypothetical protein